MTKEWLAERWHLICALKEGKTIQYLSDFRGWIDDINFNFDDPLIKYRIKPSEPTFRPWKPYEVPVGALMRFKGSIPSRSVILGLKFNESVQYATNTNEISNVFFSDLFNEWEHSIDQGINWKPCGILE